MLNLPPALVRAANKLDQNAPWLIFLDVMFEGETLYFVNNNEDLTFQGRNYNAFSFTYQGAKDSSKGELPSVSIGVSNVLRIVQGYVEQYGGGVGATCKVYIVHADNLAEDYADLTTELTVLGTKCNAKWVTFSLGGANPRNRRFPNDQYIALHCRYFKFKEDPRCGYVGTATTCNQTLDRCRELKNSARFGGFPGLDGRGIRVVM